MSEKCFEEHFECYCPTVDCWSVHSRCCGTKQWDWYLPDNHPSCSDPLRHVTRHLDVKSRFMTLAWKGGYINSSRSCCAGPRHWLHNGPLMAAMDDWQPEALPPKTLRNPLLTSSDRVRFKMWRCQEIILIERGVIQWEDVIEREE